MYKPAKEMDPMARKVDGENRMGRPRKNASAVIAQVALRGVAVRLLTTTHTLYSGTPASMAVPSQHPSHRRS